jgi:hypothetical protein
LGKNRFHRISILGGKMPASGKNFAFVMQHIRKLRGGSQPILAQASDGLIYVVKFTNNLQGANLPFNESIGSELYCACGLQVPSWKPLLVTGSFIDRNPDCWIQTPEGRLRPDPGLCFGSRFLGGDGIRLLEILPGTSFKRVRNHKSFWLAWLIDICAGHADNRQAIFLEDAMRGLEAFFVDQGHLFGGPKGEQQPRFLASRYLDPRIYPNVSSKELLNFQKVARCLDVDQLWQRIQALPDDWKTKSAIDRFAQCLCRLSTPNLLQNILDTMVEAQQQANEHEEIKQSNGRKLKASVLRPRIQAAGLGYRLVANRASRPACA